MALRKKADHIGLEKYHRRVEARPEKRDSYKGFSIFISDGGPYWDKRLQNEFPNGWYESSWFFGRCDNVMGGQVVTFDFLHDINRSNESRKQGRINAALRAAQVFIDEYEKLLKENGTKH